jgi:hypothetical protein
VIDGQLEAAEDQHRLLLQARPDSLDDATVERLVRVFTEEVDLLAVYQEQLDRWRTEQLTVAQSREVERKGGQVACNRDVAAAIHAILAKSDLELGLEVLTGRSQLFPRRRPRRLQP